MLLLKQYIHVNVHTYIHTCIHTYIHKYICINRFTGEFEWKEKLRKLVFDFDAVYVLGLRIAIKKGDAVKIGSSTGLGSEDKLSNADGGSSSSSSSGSTPMFLWISANEDIATARGGGGGLALWKRDLEMQQQSSLWGDDE